ncbi:unnamed protein product [Adineta ricciae]|uniref:Uncharacterized protein n=1 Tax=Adineta ricciae TaxID=249248 RepID=A0A814P8K3_ADIRI|nr:unnamed protein product [Adineta ricciae]
MKKVNSSLPKCDQKKKIIVQHLAEKFGLLPKSTHQRISLQLTDQLKNAVHNFYLRDDVSYQLPGFFDEKILENMSHGGAQITWSQWANENGRAEKREFSGSVGEAALLLKSKVEQFLYHVYIKREQSNYFEKLKADVTDEKIVLQVDFSENFNMKEQDEVQSAHWNSKSLSIFTAFIWSKNENFSFALPSSDLTHDKFVVDAALAIILNHIATKLPNIKEINCFSDGAASQFKQRFHFRNLTRIANKYNISLSWNFLATSHGKGVVDGIGGSAKRLVWSAVLAGEVCRTAEDFVKIAKKKTKKIILIEITADAIDRSKVELENIFKTAKSIPETLKMHSVVVVDKDELEFRYYSMASRKRIVKY